MVYLTRKIEFSASHLYHNPAFSAEENRRVFGKCNNPHGHGHNYVLEVTVAGEPDPATADIMETSIGTTERRALYVSDGFSAVCADIVSANSKIATPLRTASPPRLIMKALVFLSCYMSRR